MAMDFGDRLPAIPDGFEKWHEVAIKESELDTVIVQFFSLNWIDKSKKKHALDDLSTYWTLTTFGQNHLMRVRAIRRSEEDSEDDKVG